MNPVWGMWGVVLVTTILYNDGKVRVSCWVGELGITFDSMMGWGVWQGERGVINVIIV